MNALFLLGLALAATPHVAREDVPLTTCAVAVEKNTVEVSDLLLLASVAAVPRTLGQRAFVRRGGRLFVEPRPDGLIIVGQAHPRFTDDACRAALDGLAAEVDAISLEDAQAQFLRFKQDPGLRQRAATARAVWGPGRDWDGLLSDDIAAHRVDAATLGKRLGRLGPPALFVEGPRDVSAGVRAAFPAKALSKQPAARLAPQPTPPAMVHRVTLVLPPEVARDRDGRVLLARAYELVLGGRAALSQSRAASVLDVTLDRPVSPQVVTDKLVAYERALLSRAAAQVLAQRGAVVFEPVSAPGGQAVHHARTFLLGHEPAPPLRPAERLLWTRSLLFPEALYVR